MYDRKSIRIVAGGLNLSQPSDTIDDSEATELLNFSTDSNGSLKSRKGHTLRYTVGGRAAQMTRALGKLVIAAGGNVYADGAVIIAGVSSDLCGLVGFRDFLWACSAAAQRKSDGSNDWRWIPEAPTGKPTIKPASPTETVVDDFTGGWTVDPAGDENYNQGTLQINSQSDTVYSATKGAANDLYTGFSLDDVFRIRIWCKQWSKVEGLTFQIDVNDGTFTKDFYSAVMKKADINGGHKEEVTFYLRKRPLGVDQAAKDKKRYGHFERVGTTPEKDYRSVGTLRVKVEFNDTTKLRFEEWTMVGDVDNTLEGDDFVVYYTYTTAAGHESNRSDPSDPITVNRTGIDVSAMVASPDPQVTGQNVYLTGGTLQVVLRANANTPVSGATYNIRKGDDELLDDDLELENDHDDPPAATGLIGPYYDRLIAFGGSKIYWSHQSKPYAFAGPTLLDGDWVGADEGVGSLMAATMRSGSILFYGTNGVALLQGDPGGDSAFHRTAMQGGIQSPQGVVQTPRGDFANFSQGVYAFGGDSGDALSKKIETVFKDGGFNLERAALGYSTDVLWVSDGSMTYVLDLLTARWFRDSRDFSCFYNDGGSLVAVTSSGDVLDLNSGATDAGAAIPVAYKSKAFDCGILDNEKTFEDFTIWANTGGSTLTITAFLNDGEDDGFTVALGSISSGSKERFVLQFNAALANIPLTDAQAIKARNCAIRITGSVSSECVIHEMMLNFYVEAREAKSWDSDEKDFGTNKMKICREVYTDLHNPAAAQFIIQTDQPGFEMVTRDSSYSFAPSITRRGEPYVLPSDVMGHNLRFLLNGEDFRHYGMRALIQVIGTFLHGSRGQYWDSDVLDFGVEQVKLIKEVQIDYSGSSGVFNIKTDLPGNAMESRGNASFPSVTTEQSIKVRLPDGIKGRLFQFRYTPDGDTRIEAIRVFIKILGIPNASPWTWMSLDVEKTTDGRWMDVFLEPDSVG